MWVIFVLSEYNNVHTLTEFSARLDEKKATVDNIKCLIVFKNVNGDTVRWIWQTGTNKTE